VSRRRPFRAIAYAVDWTAPRGRRRVVVGRVAACERAGLDRFLEAHAAAGHAVDVIEIPELPTEQDPPT
jgi:hypothetical protein